MKNIIPFAFIFVLIFGSVFFLSQGSSKAADNGNDCSSSSNTDNDREICSAPVKYNCEDPGQTGRNICKEKFTVQRCKDICGNEAKNICGWSPNMVQQCRAQCTTQNGCKL